MRRSFSLAVPLSVATIFLLTLPGSLAGGGFGPANPSPTGGGLGAGPAITLRLSLQPGNLTSPLLFGSTITARAPLLPNEATLVNATPVRTIVWPGGDTGDWYDPLANFNSTTNSTTGLIYNHFDPAFHLPQVPLTSESQFVAWCKSIDCQAIMQVPGEVDNPSLARDIVAYTVNRTYTGPVWVGTTLNSKEINVTIPGLNFTPAYWEIGNEPELWTFWDLPWNHVFNQNVSLVDPTEYAQEVKDYIPLMDQANRSYTPGIIGLPGAGKGNGAVGSWISAVVSAVGSEISGIAIHIYPNGAALVTNGSAPPVEQFYQGLLGSSSFSSRVLTAERNITTDCQAIGCHLPIYDTEVGTSLSHDPFGPYSSMFPGALGVAVEASQMLSLNASTIATADVFATVTDSNNSWFNLTGVERPSYVTYSDILSHLGNDAFPITVKGPNNRNDENLSAVATVAPNDSDRRDLLVVNTDVNNNETFGTGFINSSNGSLKSAVLPATFAPGAPVEVWTWSGTNVTVQGTVKPNATANDTNATYNSSMPSTLAPVPHFYPNGLPTVYTLPPQSLALFETYNAPAYPVEFNESGLNLSWMSQTPHWYLDVNGTHTTSNSTNLTLLELPGNYATSATPLTLPVNWTNPTKRFEPFAPAVVNVAGAPLSVAVPYIVQWAINVSWNPIGGTVVATNLGDGTGPPPDWWNASAPLDLSARPSPGYAFLAWAGEGPAGNGAVTGFLNLSATLVPTANIYEQAVFVNNVTRVEFTETGLPSGTPWNVTFRGLEVNATGPSTTFYEIAGTFGFYINQVTIHNTTTGYPTTYRVQQVLSTGNLNSGGGQVTVTNNDVTTGTTVLVPIRFIPLTPPGTRYDVAFVETGLPSRALWSVNFANESSTLTLAVNPIVFNETNGTWGYHVPDVDYGGAYYYFPRPNATVEPTVNISGVPQSITIAFERIYPITFAEGASRLPAGTNWSVSVGLNSTYLQVTEWTTGTSLSILEPNGTWGLYIPQVTWINPVNQSKSIYRVELTYPDGVTNSSSNGSVLVSGGGLTVGVQFIVLTPPKPHFNVTFDETGLPSRSTWSVSFANVSSPELRAGETVTFNESNGTWGFEVPVATGPGDISYRFLRPLSELNVTIVGAAQTVTLAFAQLYWIEFTEDQLPAGTNWSVTVANSSHFLRSTAWSDHSAIVALQEPAGNWGYIVPNVVLASGYGFGFVIPGDVQLIDSNATVAITFAPLYPVLLTESGLPGGTVWSVTARLGLLTVTGSAVAPNPVLLSEDNGSIGFTASAVGNGSVNWVALPVLPSHDLNFNVTGGPISVAVHFRSGYRVVWAETGLGPGLNWSVLDGGWTNLSAAPDGWVGTFWNNGTRDFQVPVVLDYVPIPRIGTFLVDGSNVTVHIQFVRATFAVTFQVTGLPGGDVVYIRLSNLNDSTMFSSFTFQIPNSTYKHGAYDANGLYSYNLTAPNGYYATPAGGNVSVNGHTVVVAVSILPIGRGPTPPFWTLVLPAAGAATAVGVSGMAMFALLGAIRRLRTGVSPAAGATPRTGASL